jgi:hypothetical protein
MRYGYRVPWTVFLFVLAANIIVRGIAVILWLAWQAFRLLMVAIFGTLEYIFGVLYDRQQAKAKLKLREQAIAREQRLINAEKALREYYTKDR